uniref:DNA-directed RNA polymerase III subunit RPC5 C-terminal domain-containing protein n=1 Tax=Pyxicephalus adspersus TaxID=30357 RepID=A0AAV3A1J6_PYXAD|nr:TPA: hypothetical protein GDO54_015959 [Pyxicephalus adspersus]
MENEDDDPIIQEIDLFLAKSLAEKLYLFQYPVRPASMTYDGVPHLATRIKPKQQKVEMDMAINTMSPNYCRSKGEQIALNVDGTCSDESSTYSTKLMDKQTFSSIQAASNTNRYAVALYRKESEQAKQRRVQSYEFLQKKQAEESWVHLHYSGVKDSRSEHERQYLLCQNTGMTENNELIKSPSNTMLHCSVLSFFTVKVMPFANLMGLMAAGTESITVLRCIQQVALLVQGNWVVKSDVLYPKESSSPHSGVPAEVLCRGRDYVMWKFTQDRWVVRKEVAAVTKLCQEDVKEFLDHMAIPRINKGWEFMLSYDEDFIKKHPDVVQRQTMLWKGIQAKLEKVFNLSKDGLMPKKTDTSAPYTVISGDQVLNMARMKAKENQAKLERDLQRKKEQTKQTSHTAVVADVHIKEEPLSDEESMDTSTYDGLNNGLVNGVHMDENSHESVNGPLSKGDKDPLAKELNEFVASTFKKQYVLTMSELKRLFNLHLAGLPPGHTLFSGIPDKMLQETVLSSGCKQIMVPFPPQSTATPDEQKVFALWTCGDEFDRERQALLELFSKVHRLRRNMIQTKLSQEFGEDLPKQQLDKVLKDCCVCYGGMWYLKGTVQS